MVLISWTVLSDETRDKYEALLSLAIQIRSDQSLSRVRLFATPWIAARQASLSITISWSSLKLTSIESVMPSSHLILCRPLFLLPPTPPSIRVFSNESTLCMRWPQYWSFSFSYSVQFSSVQSLSHVRLFAIIIELLFHCYLFGRSYPVRLERKWQPTPVFLPGESHR